MIQDRQLTPSVAQAVTVTAFSTDVVDLASNADIGRSSNGGSGLRAFSKVDTAFTAGGAGTLLVELVQSANADLSTPDVLAQSNGGTPFALAALIQGATLMDIAIPRTSKRYLGFRYTVATGPMTAGAVTSSFPISSSTPQADRPLGVTGY